MSATVQAYRVAAEGVVSPVTVSIGTPCSSGCAGSVQDSTVTAQELGTDHIHTTVLTLTDTPVTVRDTEQGGGVKIYTFPKGKIVRLGAVSNLTITTTSAIASTLNSGVTGNHGVGSTTQASATLATTEQDFVQVTNFTSSTTINVAPAAVKAYGVPSVTLLDGSSTAISLFMNVAVAGASDIDGDATVAVNGTVEVHWIKL
jgi:hypothetical protein